MIRVALGLEMRNLMRSPLRMIVLLLVLGTGSFVLWQGQKDLRRWHASIDAGLAAQEESLAEARGYFANGEKGPADRAWVDLRQPRWQDSYAATRISRTPAPLASIAFASAESGAVTVLLNRFADPLLAEGNRIENPALAVTGGLDLVAVLALLLPLLVLALGVEIGGYERSAGVLPLVRMQSGRGRRWIWSRCIAVGTLAAATGLILTGAAIVVSGAGMSDAIPLALLVLAYVSVWTALLGTVAVVARNPSHGAVFLGATWIVLCVLIPSVGAERSAALAADDFALDLTVGARDAGAATAALSEEERFDALFTRFPGLRDQVPEPRSRGLRGAADGLRIIHLEERMASREARGEAHRRLVSLTSFASPTVAFSHALESLSGRGPAAARTFREEVAGAAATRMERYIAATWRGEELQSADFEALVASTPPSVNPPAPSWGLNLATLFAWVLALLGSAFLLAGRTASRGS